jgi:hypothetical protein
VPFLRARGHIVRVPRSVGFAGLIIVTQERLASSKTGFTASIGETKVTISKPPRFRKNGKSIANVIRGFGFRAVLACVICASSIAMHSHPASAMCAIAGGCPDPGNAYASFEVQCDPGCQEYWFLVDPRGQGVRSFHLELRFDPHLYRFDASQSAPVCRFAKGHTCRQPRARLGTFVIRKTGPFRGMPPAGAQLSYGDEPNRSGLVILDYSLPKEVNLSKDQNVFALAFHRVTSPIPAASRVTVSYFEEPGEHQFKQIAFSCNNGAVHCVGHPAIRGVDIAR